MPRAVSHSFSTIPLRPTDQSSPKEARHAGRKLAAVLMSKTHGLAYLRVSSFPAGVLWY